MLADIALGGVVELLVYILVALLVAYLILAIIRRF